jgi:serine/threonine-protein kinase
VAYDIRDEATGDPPAVPTTAKVLIRGRWLSADGDMISSLTTGAVYRFRFEAPGYYPEEYSLRVLKYQTLLALNPSLTPMPGVAAISSEVDGVSLSINGKQTYTRGGRRLSHAPVPSIDSGTTEILLPPGAYEISIEGGADGQSSLSLNIGSQRRKMIYVRQGDGRRLVLSPGPESLDRSIGR